MSVAAGSRSVLQQRLGVALALVLARERCEAQKQESENSEGRRSVTLGRKCALVHVEYTLLRGRQRSLGLGERCTVKRLGVHNEDASSRRRRRSVSAFSRATFFSSSEVDILIFYSSERRVVQGGT